MAVHKIFGKKSSKRKKGKSVKAKKAMMRRKKAKK